MPLKIMKKIKTWLKNVTSKPNNPNEIRVKWIKKTKDSWLMAHFRSSVLEVPKALMVEQIELLAEQSDQQGQQPLWEGYKNLENYPRQVKEATRSANEVRTLYSIGNFFAYLVTQKKPSIVVEFGTAFGVSGMYWLSGLESNNDGELLTFEPNQVWSEIARHNLSSISRRFQLIVGTFEDNIDSYLTENRKIELAFIDAIHTSDFVLPQFDLVVAHSAANAIIVLDDVDFSEDMKSAWQQIAVDQRVKASVTISERVGIIELM